MPPGHLLLGKSCGLLFINPREIKSVICRPLINKSNYARANQVSDGLGYASDEGCLGLPRRKVELDGDGEGGELTSRHYNSFSQFLYHGYTDNGVRYRKLFE